MQGDRRFVRLGTWGRPRGRHDAGSPQLRAWGRSLGGTEKNLTSGSASDDMSSMCTGTGEAGFRRPPLGLSVGSVSRAWAFANLWGRADRSVTEGNRLF